MTGPTAANLNRQKLHRLLAAVGSAPAQNEPMPEAAVYDWRDPHYFNVDQRNRLAAVASQVAAILSERCAHFFNSEFDVVPTSIAQHFAGDLSRHVNQERGFSLSFGPDQKPPCGFLTIGAEAALDWVTRLLGDSESDQDPDRILSGLEESLLADLVGAIAEAFLSPLRPQQELKPAGQVCRGAAAVSFEPTDPICRIVFRISSIAANTEDSDTGDGTGSTNGDSEVTFVVASPTLAPILGKSIQARMTVPQDELARLLTEHLHQMPVTIAARLASTRLSFEEVLDLAPGDILLIDKPLDEPVELIINRKTVFRGRPAQSAGQYAVFITECAADPGSEKAQ